MKKIFKYIFQELIICFIYLLFFLSEECILRLINSTEYNLSNIQPKFAKVETNPSPTEAFVKFQILENYGYQIKYKLFISEIDKAAFYANTSYFRNWVIDEEAYDSALENDQNIWKTWTEYIETSQRIIKITNLNPNSKYRLKYVIVSKFSSSKESEINFLKMPKIHVQENHIKLYIKGTGRNNHDNALVRINDMNIMLNGLYQGLALVVFDRVSMEVLDISYYDTINPPPQQYITKQFTEYSYDPKTSEIVTNKKDLEILNKNVYPSYLLYEKLNNLTERNMIALVSCYGWEKYFTNDLIDLLVKFGALNILELKSFLNLQNNLSNNTFSESLIKKTFYYHPYAFVGIVNLGGGNGFESLRTNKGHFLSVENLPFAELLINIKFDEKALNYYFDKYEQFTEKAIYADYYDYLFNSEDYSLKNLIDLLHFSNQPTKTNNLFAIYDPNKFVQRYIDKSAMSNNKVYETTFDIVTLGKGVGAQRNNSESLIYQEGLSLENKNYYDYFLKVGIEKSDCLPPYDWTKPECPTALFLSLDIPILKCKIGLTPQVCSDNVKSETFFKGFN